MIGQLTTTRVNLLRLLCRRHLSVWMACACLFIVQAVRAQATVEIRLPEMITVPGACFEMGTLLMDSRGNTPREVCLETFAISAHEITIGEFKAFLRMTGLPTPSPMLEALPLNLPVVNITWFEAMAYTRWLSEFTGDTYTLPTEEQWEYAAGAALGAGTQYGWGDRLLPDMANCFDCGTGPAPQSVKPVGSFPPGPLGLYDMHGNADEWTLGCFHAQDERVERRILRNRLATCRNVTVRGGSYRNTANRLRIWQRAGQDATRGDDDIGFRVVRLCTGSCISPGDGIHH